MKRIDLGLSTIRNKRSKTALNSELESIVGIGDKTILELLKKFKSAQRVSFAALDELEQVIGVSKAQIIYNYYQKNPMRNLLILFFVFFFHWSFSQESERKNPRVGLVLVVGAPKV